MPEITQQKVEELLQLKKNEVGNNIFASIELQKQIRKGFVELEKKPLQQLFDENHGDWRFVSGGYGNTIKVGDKYCKFSKLFPEEYQNVEFIKEHTDWITITLNLWVEKRQLYYHVNLENLPSLNEFVVDKNEFLGGPTRAFYHVNYRGYGNPGNPNYINILKNEGGRETNDALIAASGELKEVLGENIPVIKEKLGNGRLLVVVAPRSKASQAKGYQWFRNTVKEWIGMQDDRGIVDGTDYIVRVTDTKCTHLNALDDVAPEPYKGITKDTCQLVGKVDGEHVLFVDDIYTPYVNIDEDAIQYLLENNAASVTLYTIGRTFK